MHKLLLTVLSVAALFASIFLWHKPVVSAQANTASPNKSALAVSPAIVEHVLQPGAAKEFTLRLSNLTDFPLPISGTVKSFEPLEEIGDPKKRALYDASKWFTITEPDFILQSKQTREVKVRILPPAAAEPGGHYATVYFQPLLPAGALTPSTAHLSARVGSLAFLIVPGDIEQKLTVAGFTVPRVHQSGPLTTDVTLKNTGGVHLSPSGKIILRNWRNKPAGELAVAPGVILPGTEKKYTASWDNPPLFGKYTATYQTAYGAGNTALRSATATIWIVPWALLLAVCIPLAVMVLIALRTRGRWRQAWQILRGKEHHTTKGKV